MPTDATGGILTSLNTGAVNGGLGERVLVDYKDVIMDYKVTDLPVMQFFADPMTTDTGGNIDITFARPSMKLEQIDEGTTPQYQHTKLRSERVGVKEWGIAVGVTRRMIEDSRFNEVEMALNEARKAVDRHMTQHVVKAVSYTHLTLPMQHLELLQLPLQPQKQQSQRSQLTHHQVSLVTE